MTGENMQLPPFAAIVVAAGQGSRAEQRKPKQFADYRGKPLVAHSVQTLVEAGANPIVVAIPKGAELQAMTALGDFPQIRFVTGGATRHQSVYNALEELAEFEPGLVLIHDAARPDLPHDVIARLLTGLKQHHGAIPVLEVVDTLLQADGELMGETAPRGSMRRVQTPQAFHFGSILGAHRGWPGDPVATDDAQVLRESGGDVVLVQGDERLKKVTYAQDFAEGEGTAASAATNSTPAHPTLAPSDPAPFRCGTGYDVHQLEEGETLVLCGVEIDHTHGLSGHSDADVGIHAVVDALLGAVAAGDIGDHFPPGDPKWAGVSSDRFLAHACTLVGNAGYRIASLDVTLVCEAPKIGPHRQAMRERLAGICGIDTAAVSVKATTTEGLGFTGRGEGIAAQASAAVVLG